MEINQSEIKEISSINESIPQENNIQEEKFDINIFKDIFIFKEIDSKLKFYPILNKSKNLGDKLISIFAKPSSDIKQNINLYLNFITNRIELYNNIKDIIGNSYEIFEIMLNFLRKNNIFPIIDILELYTEILYLFSVEKDKGKNGLIDNIKNILKWMLSGGLIHKTHTDYIFQRLSKLTFEKKLTSKLFHDYLSLIELIYGKEFDIKDKKCLIAKNYIYFYDAENSMIKTNISKSNTVYIKDGCTIIFWFYINQEQDIENKLCDISIDKGKETNHHNIEFFLDENYDINVNFNSNLLKEHDGKKFEIKRNKWIQLKIQITKNIIKLCVYQDLEDVMNIKYDNEKGEEEQKANNIFKYETKVYYLNNKNSLYNNDINIELIDFRINDLNFFVNYLGYVGTIIFCDNDNPSEVPIKSLYGLKSNKISNFIEETALSNIYFILSPSLYINEQNKFVYMNKNMTAELQFNQLEEDIKTIIDYNNIYKTSNIFNNIYLIGGSINILPLFEIFYKMSKSNNDNTKDVLLENIFYKLFQLIEIIIVDKPKNYLDMHFNNNNVFFESMQLFLENINEKFYKNDETITILINIGKFVLDYCKNYQNNYNTYFFSKKKSPFFYFEYILFYPKIVLKFSLQQQNRIWKFFEDEKMLPKKEIKPTNFVGINISLCKKCFIPFNQINNFILLFNQKYPNEYLSPELINIIKYLVLASETTDRERESLILLINNINKKNHKNRISDKIIISIFEIFVFYFESKKSNVNNTKMTELLKLEKKDTKDNILSNPTLSLESFLNSGNYFIENILRILTTNNLDLKDSIINFIKIISQKYIDTLVNYFIKVESEIKKSKKKNKINKVSGNEFYYFIQENITPNDNNKIIRQNQVFMDNFINENYEEDKERRKSSMDSLNLINKGMNQNKSNENNDDEIDEINEPLILKKTRSATPETKRIDDIKYHFFQKNKYNIKIPRKTDFNFSDNRISNPYEINSQQKLTRVLTFANPVNEFLKIEEDEDMDNKDDKLALLEAQNTNCRIALNLFQWLLYCETVYPNKKKSSGSSSSSSFIYDKNIEFNFSEIIINFILKLLYDKNTEVIRKILFSIIANNSEKNNKGILIDNYTKLLGYFSSSKSKFIQFLEELMVNSYLCIYYEDNKKKFNSVKDLTNSVETEKEMDEHFKEIYEESKQIIIDIYFYENKFNNKIINEVFDIVLSLYGGLKNMNEENIQIKKILFAFLENFLVSIVDLFNSNLDYYRKQLKNKISNVNDKNERIRIIYKEIKNKYCIFLNFIFEYLFLLTNSNYFLSMNINIKNETSKNFYEFPDFLNYEIDKDGNKKLMDINLDLYLKLYSKIINIFNIEKDLYKANNSALDKKVSSEMIEKKEKIKKEKYKKDIFYLEPTDISKLLKEYANNKDLRNKLRDKFNFMLLSSSEEFKDIPLIIILTILNNYYISKKIKEKIDPKSEEGLNFIYFINSHMKFLLTVIMMSFVLKESDNYHITKSFKDIQEIIFAVLLYNINNIIASMDSAFCDDIYDIFANIITLLSYLWVEDKEHKSLFSLSKNKPKIIVKRILNYYSLKYKTFFDSAIFEKLASQNIIKNREIIVQESKNIYKSIISNSNNIEEKEENLPAINIFDISYFQKIYNTRKIYLKNNLKLLINESFEYNSDENDEQKNNYEKILLKVDKLKVCYDNNEIYNYCWNMIKRKNYRKIKKQLYSWNNSYSNIDVFYNKKEKEEEKNDEICLKYKISNYLSNDMTRKLIVPIIDIDYYMPKFQIFNYEEKLFRINEKTKINQYKNVYKTDLKIFDEQKYNIAQNEDKEENKFNVYNICYIKATHHIRGKLFFEKNSTNHNNKYPFSICEKIPSLFFLESNISNENILLKNYEDYDSESQSCFISIFKNNKNPKDPETFLKINFSDIVFIFLRKYCFRNNSIEIFLSNHRSYYFKFFDMKKRDNFVSELIFNLNKENPKNKIFRQIKSIDENNKTIILGYYRDEENNKEYSSIQNILNLWKNNRISTLELLMWINIYGNRSYRDSSQYPVFPWLLTNHDYKTFDELLQKIELRDFNYPMGLISIDEKSKKRQEGYLETFKLMVMNLTEENLINIKIKEEEDIIEEKPINNKFLRNSTLANNTINLNLGNQNSSQSLGLSLNNRRNESVVLKSYNQEIPNIIEQQTQDKYIPKIPDYKFEIERLYNSPNFEYEKIPYCFGSHYSNSMYVCHYLMRLFPYCLNMIEIQKSGFDVPERLFYNLQSSLYAALSDKGDLREIIPEFFTVPEMFLNINSLELGQLNTSVYEKNGKNENVENEDDLKSLNEVIMPMWCKDNPFLFSEKYRKILEYQNININPWIDLIFGYTQRGVRAQKVGNLFLPYAYDGVMNIRLTKENLLKNREENEFQMRFFEMGVHPTKVFEKKNKYTKNKITNQFYHISGNFQINLPEIRLKKMNDTNNLINIKKLIYFDSYLEEDDEFFILDSNFVAQKINIQESKQESKEKTDKSFFYIKESLIYKEFPIKDKINKNIQNKLIIKSIFKKKYFIIAGYFDGSLYVVKAPSKLSKKEDLQKIVEKPYYINEENIIKNFDKSLITSLEIDKQEKYLIYGTMNGSVVIYYLNHNLFKENKSFIEFQKIFRSHNESPITSISINSDLNMFADCSIDGYINIYTLTSHSNYSKINSIYISSPFIPYYIFLSAQPLPCIVLYSNALCQFKSFSLNGNELNTTESDNNLMSAKLNEYFAEYDQNMSSPLVFTDWCFNDYLVYIFKNNYVLIREFPSMNIKIALNPTFENHNESLCSLSISEDKKYLYIYEQKSNKIYMFNQKIINNKDTKKNI